MYWCSVCGNPDVVVETKKEGYSLGKGLAGQLILGPGGAIAGFDGKKKTLFYCPKCGARLDHCMPLNEVEDICQMLKNPLVQKEKLEQTRTKYPYMIWPKELTEEKNYESIKEKSNDVKDDLEITGDLKEDIRHYLNKLNMPLRYKEIEKLFSSSKRYSNVQIRSTVLSLIEEGLLKTSEDYVTLVRDIDEMIMLKKTGSELRIQFDNYLPKSEGIEEIQISLDEKKTEIIDCQRTIMEDSLREICLTRLKNELLGITREVNTQQRFYDMSKRDLERAENLKETTIKRQLDEIAEKINEIQKRVNEEEAANAETYDTIQNLNHELSLLSFIQLNKKKKLRERISELNDIYEKTRDSIQKKVFEIEELKKSSNEVKNKVNEALDKDRCREQEERIKLDKLLVKQQEICQKKESLNLHDEVEKLKSKTYIFTHELPQNIPLSSGKESHVIMCIIENVLIKNLYNTVPDICDNTPEIKGISRQKTLGLLNQLVSLGYAEKKSGSPARFTHVLTLFSDPKLENISPWDFWATENME